MRIGEKIAQFAHGVKSNPYSAVAIGCALATIAAIGIALITEGDLSDVLAGSSVVAFVGTSIAVPCYFYRKQYQQIERDHEATLDAKGEECLPGIIPSVATKGEGGFYYNNVVLI